VNAVNRPARILWEQLQLPRAIAGLDCLLNPGFTAPALRRCPMVTVFHDMQHKRHPEYFKKVDLPFWNVLLGVSAARSDLLLADSEATRADIIRYYGVPESRIRVCHLGVGEDFLTLRRDPDRERPFFLCVSTLHPHKNLEALVRAFVHFRERRPEYRLVIAGLRGFFTEQLEALVRGLRMDNHVELTGWIERSALIDLYRRAAAFVYPSRFEGFGLPVLEAMAAGVPLACSDIPPLREVAGSTALMFPPDDPDALLNALLTVEQSTLVEAAKRRAREFSWAACARRTLDALVTATGPRAGS
jgi:glycosyltransferase involved in cell wall biosynthesis